jgi:predicted protein tyrosine phosphatase
MNLIISSLYEMGQYMGKVTHMISLTDSDPDDIASIPSLGVPSERRLVLVCDDVESIGEASARKREIPGSRCIAPTSSMVKKSLAFAGRLRDSDRLLIHCGYGISRSTALALAILAQAEPELDEAAVFQKVLKLRPQASPNALIVKYADKLLKRRGRLSRAILAR